MAAFALVFSNGWTWTHAGVVAGSRAIVANNRNRIAIVNDQVF